MAVDSSPVGVQNLKGTIELGQQVLKSLELVNGGAVIAILTFYGNAVKDGAKVPLDPTSLRQGLEWFAAGLVIAVLAACFAYFGQLAVATGEPDEPGKDPANDADHRRKANLWSKRFLCVGALLALVSLGAFARGTWASAEALLTEPTHCPPAPSAASRSSGARIDSKPTSRAHGRDLSPLS